MSLEKAIVSGKEHRRRYFGAKSVCKSCRNHGGCSWCEGNRLYKSKKKIKRVKEELRRFLDGE